MMPDALPKAPESNLAGGEYWYKIGIQNLARQQKLLLCSDVISGFSTDYNQRP
jgi:hypothetical protein